MGLCRGMRRIMRLLMRKLDLEDVDIGCLVLLWGMDHGVQEPVEKSEEHSYL